MINGPDFICIGLPKAGTGWLFDQLEDHPDFWMPPVKELAYLTKKNPELPFVNVEGEDVPHHRERRVHRETLDERDRLFLEYAASCRGKPLDLDLYAGFFRFKGDLKSGDITPPYCNLRGQTISALARRFPETRIVLLVRDPIARAWSRISMAARNQHFNPRRLTDPEAFRSRLQEAKKTGRLLATEVLSRWREHGPDLNLQVFFFDDIVEAPERTRHDILEFLGADPEKLGKLPANHDRKAAETKLEMPDAIRSVLIEHFAQELRLSPGVFGGRAKEWPARYGVT